MIIRYMKYYCKSSLSWGEDGTGDNVVIPSPLPEVSEDWRQEVYASFSVYMIVIFGIPL